MHSGLNDFPKLRGGGVLVGVRVPPMGTRGKTMAGGGERSGGSRKAS